MKILVIDNYDSFVFNLVQLLQDLNCKVDVVKNDQIPESAITSYDKVLISPGPGVPKEAGGILEFIQSYKGQIPILGVCLGHQAIGEALGLSIVNLTHPKHGIASEITQETDQSYLFKDLPQTFQVGHYHSWVIENHSSSDVRVTSRDHDGNIMSIEHASWDLTGVQFHPESILTPLGKNIITNWINHSS